ncbi:N-acetylmannosamine-6-phosphate 2-epimerase [Oceanobacillus chungangensis]|uniref:Putative N-acetylmannosamine-6-phosphate 2-epimerase n=1 Tax=Oceanobacillus chungangensis TaxID=1229152 RepID=A0A3D8Q1C1_9BACI|nr:N-acetylmannosamine-6-phosphate 2-epimerase [Oceanobacillus chungangensis]RDW20805.1 N-acetylmannosamine-6-phosphate 2-epimerase [Oceanobacillus chungangensis]
MSVEGDSVHQVLQCKREEFLNRVRGKLIVSCQALDDEPLYGSEIMAKMALAADQGGAAGIRANGVEDIAAIKKEISLPIIGLIKRNYDDSEVYITPTKKEIAALIDVGVDLIALDATKRKRPNGEKLEDLIEYAHSRGQLVLADISTVEEGLNAQQLGADIISTTMSGYTEYTKSKNQGPDIELVRELCKQSNYPVIAEGRISTPEEAVLLLEIGAHAVIVGSAISRPKLITEQFTKAIMSK